MDKMINNPLSIFSFLEEGIFLYLCYWRSFGGIFHQTSDRRKLRYFWSGTPEEISKIWAKLLHDKIWKCYKEFHSRAYKWHVIIFFRNYKKICGDTVDALICFNPSIMDIVS